MNRAHLAITIGAVILAGLLGYGIGRMDRDTPSPEGPQAPEEFPTIVATSRPATQPAPREAPRFGTLGLNLEPVPTWPLVRVVDGDTAIIKYAAAGPTEERLRFLRIDAPERGEPGFAEATAALKKLLGDGPVRIEFEEPGVLKRDNFGRLLVYVFNERGQNVNVELVRLGWSLFQTKYGEGRLAVEFRNAQAEASHAMRGLWAKVPDMIDRGGGDAFEPSAPVIRKP
jgi:endonuclease YncB( thermonuclease family)